MSELAYKESCRSTEVAAYLDGELGAGALLAFEEHLKECSSCAGKLEEQRRLLCTLDMAFSDEKTLSLPADFARVVTAHAQMDMSGVRERRERGRALSLSLILALFSFALLGSAALSDSVFEPVRVFGRLAGTGFGILWRAIYDAGATLAVIMRIIGRFAFESHPAGFFSYLLLGAALLLLLRLIRGYHRARATE
ncbi:MAG TPA: zf-HC2 domain-containing protein [Pyrinomonadaceae bacterium]|nr:zf-HC2 domain-containing protein [Pyrinomonadaceae bacterium]